MALSNLFGWHRKMETAPAAACGSACGAGDKPEEKPAACGSACGAGDQPKEKPAACGSAEEKPAACGSGLRRRGQIICPVYGGDSRQAGPAGNLYS